MIKILIHHDVGLRLGEMIVELLLSPGPCMPTYWKLANSSPSREYSILIIIVITSSLLNEEPGVSVLLHRKTVQLNKV